LAIFRIIKWFSRKQYLCTIIVLYESPENGLYITTLRLLSGSGLTNILTEYDSNIFNSIFDLAKDVKLYGYYGGIRLLKAEINIYKLTRNSEFTVQALVTLLSNILQSARYYPYMAMLVVGGADKNGMHIYSVDPVGGIEKDNYVVTGSGSPIAIGVLEDKYKENLTKEEGIEFRFLTNPKQFMGNDKGWVTAMECYEMELGEPDASGRRRPIIKEGSEFTIDVDVAIVALGTTSARLNHANGRERGCGIAARKECAC
jgi:hypothetical protein